MSHPRLSWALCAGGMLLLAAEPALAAPEAYDSHGKRDPFVPLVHDGRFISVTGGLAPGSPVSELHLAGIVWDPSGASLALINETEVNTGDQIEGYQVMEIRPDAVVLMKDGKPVILQLTFEASSPSEEQRGGESP